MGCGSSYLKGIDAIPNGSDLGFFSHWFQRRSIGVGWAESKGMASDAVVSKLAEDVGGSAPPAERGMRGGLGGFTEWTFGWQTYPMLGT